MVVRLNLQYFSLEFSLKQIIPEHIAQLLLWVKNLPPFGSILKGAASECTSFSSHIALMARAFPGALEEQQKPKDHQMSQAAIRNRDQSPKGTRALVYNSSIPGLVQPLYCTGSAPHSPK